MRPYLSFAVSLGLASSPAAAASRPIVVELFTSQGCSSCPPADAYLTTLAGRPDVLALAFHVTYWNALGWRDPFSFQAATDRQATYAARLGGGSYTPEMVVDGRAGLVGSRRDAVDAAIVQAREAVTEALPVRVGETTRGLTVAVGPGAGRGRVLLIGYDPRHETPVGRGENGGRTLVESNIVRSLQTIADYDGAPLTIAVSRGAGAATAVIVEGLDGRIIAAAGP